MTLSTRPLNNIGSPLCLPDGTPVPDAAVTFTLVSPRGQPVDGQDAISGERVVWKATTTTNAAGEFTVKAWPNSRGTYPTKYLCHVDHPGVRDCYGVVTEGTEALSWAQFMASGESTGGGIMPPSNPGGGATSGTNLSITLAAETLTVCSDTGNDAALPAATSMNAGLMLPAQVVKLAGLEQAVGYTHPDTHPAAMIEQDADHRFVTDADRQAWDDKQPAGNYAPAGQYATGSGTASGTNTGDETAATLGATLAGAAAKATPADADTLPLVDATGGILKKLSWASLKAAIRSALVSAVNTWTKAQVGGVSDVAVAGNTITIADLSAANNYSVSLQATTPQTLANPTANILPGQSGQIVITQNAAPSILTFGSFWKPYDGTTQAVSTTAGAQNLLSYYVASPTAIWFSLAKQGVA